MVSEELRGTIPDYVRGLLTAEEAAEVEAAIAGDSMLMHEHEEARRYYAMLCQLPEVKAHPDFSARVSRSIRRRIFGRRIKLFLKPKRVLGAATAAAIALGAAAFVFYVRPHLERQAAVRVAAEKTIQTSTDSGGLSETIRKKQVPGKNTRPVKPPEAARPARPQQSFQQSVPAALPPLSGVDYQENRPGSEKPAPSVDSESPVGVSDTAMHTGRTVEPPARPESLARQSETPPVAAAIVDIGTVEMRSTAQTAPALDSLMVLYDTLLTVSTRNGDTAYTLSISPDRLSTLLTELERSYSLNSHLLEVDPLQAKRVKVTLIVNR